MDSGTIAESKTIDLDSSWRLQNKKLLSSCTETASCALQDELQAVKDGLLRGSSQRMKEAAANPVASALELAGGFATGLGLSAALQQGGRLAFGAKCFASVLAAGMGADIWQRSKSVGDLYSATALSGKSPQALEARKEIIAEQIGKVLPDYLAAFSTAGFGAASFQLGKAARQPERFSPAQNSELASATAFLKTPNSHLRFRVDRDFLAFHTLSEPHNKIINGEIAAPITAFKNRAWDLDKEAYDYLRKPAKNYYDSVEYKVLYRKPLDDGTEISKRAAGLLETMKRDPSFIPVLKETERAKQILKQDWEKNYPKTRAIMDDLTGLKLDQKLEVLITHPSIRQGMAAPEQGRIFFTDQSHFPGAPKNTNLIYLWHETLHHHIPPRIVGPKQHDVGHSVIELATDNELRVRLNGGSYPPMIGHPYLQEAGNHLLSSWRNYLKQAPGKRNIMDYLEKASKLVEKMPS